MVHVLKSLWKNLLSNYYFTLIGDKISAQLKSFGLPLYDLPPETQLCIQVLAETAYNLQVNNSSPMRCDLYDEYIIMNEGHD